MYFKILSVNFAFFFFFFQTGYGECGGDLVLALKLFVRFGFEDLTALSSRQRGRHTYACVVVVPLCLELKLIRHKGGASLSDVGRKLQKHKVHKYASHIA